ncbi:MAG: putative 2-phosphosulfolactate phosphatase [Planctomycetota bacterium]|nr:MAG: putative 2-phosphosulfolactate phosphatase [Planctomycetota bacterium]
MIVECALLPSMLPEALSADDHAVVIDVVRATSFLVTALELGARGVEPVAEVAEARARAAERGALLAGERGGLPPEGFDLGNSPRELNAAVVRDRDIVLSTTNGTAAVARCAGAGRVLAGALLNAEATARALGVSRAERVWLVCAGSGGELALDDVAAAGCLAGQLVLSAGAELREGARLAAALFDQWKHDLHGLLASSTSGRKLIEVGLGEDLRHCAKVDALPFAVELDSDGRFVKSGAR